MIFYLSPFANPMMAERTRTAKEGNLELKGLLADENRARSLIREAVILRTFNQIDITFFIRCSIKISVINEDNGNTVYENHIPDTRLENRLLIDTGTWEEANYKIIFENTNNSRTAYACFEIE